MVGYFTFTEVPVSRVSRVTGADEATDSVSAVSIGIAESVTIHGTLINI